MTDTTIIMAKPRHTALWSLANLLLIAVLALQYAYFMRDDLARHSSLRPFLQQLCQSLSCELSMQRDTSQIRIIDREVRSHPGAGDALLVSVTLSNQAPFTQPYPLLQLSFSDRQGQPVASRRFLPAEYLAPDIDPSEGMPSHTPISTRLEIVDPGEEAVNFQFDFL